MEHNQAGSRITLIGMAANLGMSGAKGVAGVYFHSSALLADAAHSMSDILGDLVTLYTFRKSRRPLDRQHPFGYGRYEALGTLFVSGFLVAAGLGLGWHALEQAVEYLPAALWSADVAAGKEMVDSRAMWFAGGSIVVNEALFQATMKVARKTHSGVLVANAWHHRSDALTSLVSVGAIGGAIMGFPILDAVGGLAVSAMLAKSGAEMTVDAVREITDTPPPMEATQPIQDALESAIRDAGAAVQGVGNLRCRRSGPFVHVYVGLEFAGTASAADIACAVDQVKQGLRERVKSVQNINVDVLAKEN